MPFDATVLQVMIASPSDVRQERLAIKEALQEWNSIHAVDRKIILLPRAWEDDSSPVLGRRAQQVINEQFGDSCDLLIGVFWTRLGSPTGGHLSGTVEEIQRHVRAGKPAVLYFSRVPVVPGSYDAAQWEALQSFKRDSVGLFEEYDNPEEFRQAIRRHLALTMVREFKDVGRRSAADAPEGTPASLEDHHAGALSSLSADAAQLLAAMGSDSDGTLLMIRTLGGTTVQAGRRVLADLVHGREEARWDAAVAQAEVLGLIVDRAGKGEVFTLTADGYGVVDLMNRRERSGGGAIPPEWPGQAGWMAG